MVTKQRDGRTRKRRYGTYPSTERNLGRGMGVYVTRGARGPIRGSV
jgi:hypothetical protein